MRLVPRMAIMAKRQQTSSKTMPVSSKTLPVASLNLAGTSPTSPLVNASTPRQASASSLLTPVKVSRASLLVRAASFGRLRRPAPVAEPVTVPAILDRLQSSGGGRRSSGSSSRSGSSSSGGGGSSSSSSYVRDVRVANLVGLRRGAQRTPRQTVLI
mgnify:CR=1 FL=1